MKPGLVQRVLSAGYQVTAAGLHTSLGACLNTEVTCWATARPTVSAAAATCLTVALVACLVAAPASAPSRQVTRPTAWLAVRLLCTVCLPACTWGATGC